MDQATAFPDTTGRTYPAPPLFCTSADATVLRDVLRRCSAATYDAVCRFRRTGDAALLAAIIPGLIERYVEPELRSRLRDPADQLRLSEDLGLDSLTLIEFVMFAEDVLQVSIDNAELSHLRTLGDIQRFVEARLSGLILPPPATLAFADPG